jgi:hypothetical protein
LKILIQILRCENEKTFFEARDVTPEIESDIPTEPITKKRGRKPKGGKLINKNIIETTQPTVVSNVILHLKCSLKDIYEYDIRKNEEIEDPMIYNPSVPPEIMTYDTNQTGFSFYSQTEKPDSNITVMTENKPAYIDTLCKKCKCSLNDMQNDGGSGSSSSSGGNIGETRYRFRVRQNLD